MHIEYMTSFAISSRYNCTYSMTVMPIDSPHLFKPHEPSQDWRRLSEWKAPKIPLIESRTESLTPLYGQSQGIGSSGAMTPQSSSVVATVPRPTRHPTHRTRTKNPNPSRPRNLQSVSHQSMAKVKEYSLTNRYKPVQRSSEKDHLLRSRTP